MSTARKYLDPMMFLQLPEKLEEYLDDASVKCLAFNRRGTLLAVGCTDGATLIYDTETMAIAGALRGLHSKAVISVSWSRDGRSLLTGGADLIVGLWRVDAQSLVQSFQMGKDIAAAHVNPRHPHLLVCSYTRDIPWVFDLKLAGAGAGEQAGGDEDEMGAGEVREAGYYRLTGASGPPPPPGAPRVGPSGGVGVATWTPRGSCIITGSSKGFLAIFDARHGRLPAADPVAGTTLSGGARILSLSVDRRERHLVASATDGAIRLFNLSVPAAGTPASGFGLELVREMRVGGAERVVFRRAALSHDLEWVAGAAEGKEDHRVFIFSASTGRLDRLLACEARGEGVGDMAWHPRAMSIATTTTAPGGRGAAGSTGRVFFFSPVLHDKWSMFAPDFRELTENEEYVEKEDEFDLNRAAAQAEREREGRAEEILGGALGSTAPDPSAFDSLPIDLLAAPSARPDLYYFTSDDELEAADPLHYMPVRIRREEEEVAADAGGLGPGGDPMEADNSEPPHVPGPGRPRGRKARD